MLQENSTFFAPCLLRDAREIRLAKSAVLANTHAY